MYVCVCVRVCALVSLDLGTEQTFGLQLNPLTQCLYLKAVPEKS